MMIQSLFILEQTVRGQRRLRTPRRVASTAAR
jgi:hypothetical protein